jgi:hypothetical protein
MGHEDVLDWLNLEYDPLVGFHNDEPLYFIPQTKIM